MTTTLELAHAAARKLGGWTVSECITRGGELDEDDAYLESPDKDCVFRVSETQKGKTVRLNVWLDTKFIEPKVEHANEVKASREHSESCVATSVALAGLIGRMFPAARVCYTEIRQWTIARDLEKKHNIAAAKKLAEAFGVRVAKPIEQYGQENHGDYIEVSVRQGDLLLHLLASGDSWLLKGFSNHIPMDLMDRFLPIIQEWIKEQNG